MFNKIWNFLNSKFALLLLGFIFTTVIGGLLNERFQRKAWEREVKRQDLEWERNRKFEILRRKLNEGQKSLGEISDLINLHFFASIRYLIYF